MRSLPVRAARPRWSGRLGRTAAALIAAAVAPAASHAQHATASLAVGTVSVRYTDADATSALTISPAFVLRAPTAFLAALGSAARLKSGEWSPQATLVVSTFTPTTASGFSGELGFAAGGSGHTAGLSSGNGSANARLHWVGSRVGGWIGGSAGTTWTGTDRRGFRAGEFGGMVQREAATFFLRATPTRTADQVRFTDLTASADGAVGALDLSLAIGARVGAVGVAPDEAREIWGGTSLALWVAPRVALVGAAGVYPSDPTEGFPSGRYVSVSLRVGGWRAVRMAEASSARAVRREAAAAGIARLQVERVGDERFVLRVHAPLAAGVEMMGDATLWQPAAFTRAADGWWTLEIRAQGSTELLLRADGGAWTVPPGTIVVTDEFGGRVGRLVLP